MRCYHLVNKGKGNIWFLEDIGFVILYRHSFHVYVYIIHLVNKIKLAKLI